MESPYTDLTDEEMILESKRICKERGIEKDKLPVFTERFTNAELADRQKLYMECIEVIRFFVDQFLASASNTPILITVTDYEAHILEVMGSPEIANTVKQLGIEAGIGFNEDTGTNSIDLCIHSNRPVQVIGSDHYHVCLQNLACYSTPFYWEGKVAGTISMMTEVGFAHPHLMSLLRTFADSVERELMLRKQNSQLHMLNHLLIEKNYYGVLVTDSKGNILQMNEVCVNILDLSPKDLKAHYGSPVFEIQEVGSYFRQAIEHQMEYMGEEISIPSDGSMRYYMLDVFPVYDRKGVLARVAGNLRDITEMKRTEEVLRNTEKLVFAGQVAVSIAHEVRNPLTTVKGMLQLANKESNLRHYELIMSEIERMNLIVGEFLILGKPQAIHFKQDKCETILTEVLNVFGIQAALNEVEIQMECVQSPVITCDRNQIKQVFLNILRNSMEALPFGGDIDILLSVEEGYQVISFTDNGTGMTEEVLQRIGEPFHTTKPEGNGLGMMIVQRILNTHKGHMSITSKEGTGTTVKIYLPMDEKISQP
ncbi:ATP-binding protein [Paenibacillus dakarensis]|uniref:ATP-binding protein n=1 Tax=Paenibacillus dakarensis TaxID=1527293 RepID=UPI0009EC38CE|nr:ATP-binding protein [Paenibacillus dakarensis]